MGEPDNKDLGESNPQDEDSEQDPSERKSKKPTDPSERKPSRGALMLILLGIVLTFGLGQYLATQVGPRVIRYDEFKRHLREDRVDWIAIESTSLRGAYLPGKAPNPPVGTAPGTPSSPAGADTPQMFSTPRVDDPNLIPLLEERGIAFAGQPSSAWSDSGPTFLYMGLMILLMLFLWRGVFKRMGGAQGGALSFGKSRGKVTPESSVDVSFQDVAGADEAKAELSEIVEFLQRPDKFKKIGAKIPKGVLLVGPPGTGKTLMARAIAGEAGVPFISISGSEFVEMFVGVGAARVRDLFEQAAKIAPCIIFIDELDALGRSRGGAQLGGNEERESTLNQLLVELDGFAPREAVITLAATNRPEVLDPALLRPGRFDRQVLIDRPDRSGREAILRVHVRSVALGGDVDLEEMARRTPGFSGADLANLINEAALIAARRGGEQVQMRDLSSAIDRVVAGLEKKSRLVDPEERRRVAYHEVGHALCGTAAGSGDRVHKISIVPRGMAALGFTMQAPDHDQLLMTESHLRARLVGLLGGRAAEEVIFTEPSSGAQNDLQKATDLARAMVTEYGMSQSLGPVFLGRESGPIFLGDRVGGPGRDAHGSRVADEIDREVQALVSQALAEGRRLLETLRPLLERMTEELLRDEQLEGERLNELLSGVPDAQSLAPPEGPPHI